MHNDYDRLPLGVIESLATLLGTPAKFSFKKNEQCDKRDISFFPLFIEGKT